VVRKILTKSSAAPRSTTSPATTTSSCAVRRFQARAGQYPRGQRAGPHTPDGASCWCCTATLRRHHPLSQVAGLAGDFAYERRWRRKLLVQPAAGACWPAVLALSAYAKDKVKGAVNVISQFEDAVARECKRRGLDGVICGHIHHAEIATCTASPITTAATGESCTALAEDFTASCRSSAGRSGAFSTRVRRCPAETRPQFARSEVSAKPRFARDAPVARCLFECPE